ncbi:HNH endonuclease signature motif containing protein [Agromyces terreus]|nr:HNH endonuclease signature motif containing protein [Agromyces terreus]
MSDDGLVRATEALARLGRRVEALQARCAAGVAERSSGVDPQASLARKHGHSSPERLIAQATGGRYADAARLVAVGQATSTRASFAGDPLAPRHPHVADALDRGAIGVSAAEVIRRFTDGLATRCERADLEASERWLVERAPQVGIDGLVRLIKQLEARLDPEGVKPREDELRARRGLSIWEDASGVINLKGAFDPVNGAPIKLAIETLVGVELRRARDAKRPFGSADDGEIDGVGTDGVGIGPGDTGPGGTGPGGTDPVMGEVRTIQQLNADALADIARLSLTSKQAPAALRAVTVVARVDAVDFTSGRGHATLDGIDQPISIASVHELATAAGIAPMLMGEGHHVLEFGRAARLFSAAQKIALVERDGGCAWPGCSRPPSHAEAHHIAWWKRDNGTTDLANGIMLCAFHHHRVHDDGWRIEIRDGRSWFIPPARLDPHQRPRPGNAGPRHPANRPPGRTGRTGRTGRISPMQSADAA